MREVIDAAVTQSDNTAGNLFIGLAGGPRGLDLRLARIGDEVISVDRREPALNSAVPGDTRDTTTPEALATTLGELVLGDALPAADRRLLLRTLRRSTTGAGLVRAAVPDGWVVGDKTGTSAYGGRNDVAVVHPPGREPLLVAVMTTHASPDAEPDDALVATAARVALRALER